MKKTLFTIDYYEFPNFLNDEDINKYKLFTKGH